MCDNIEYRCESNNLPIWVGAEYETGGIFQIRICVIGDSGYTQNRDPAIIERIREIDPVALPREHIAKEDLGRDNNFRGGLFKVFRNGKDGSCEERRKFWRSVLFFNYLTTPLDGPGMAGSSDLFLHHHHDLGGILDSHRPNLVVLVGGVGLSDNIVNNNGPGGQDFPIYIQEGPKNEIAGQRRRLMYFSNGNHTALVATTYHVGRRRNNSIDCPVVNEAIRLASIGCDEKRTA